MICPGCGHDNPTTAKFCGECGARLASHCAACGSANPPGQKFCGECGKPLTAAAPSSAPQSASPFGAPQSYTPKHLAERILTSKAALEGERKHVTVLFTDVKGSMELLADRDPEEARKIIDPVLAHMMEAVHRYEGTVNQVMGDGIMALFGAPLAHEDHAARACYAALRMQDLIRRYTEETRSNHGIEVHIRVGINSGEVVVRSIGSDLRMDYSAVGQTTHLAARMEQLAPPGATRLTSETLRLAEGFIQVKPLGAIPIKGVAEPREVFELAGAAAVRTRLQAARARGFTPLTSSEQPDEGALSRRIDLHHAAIRNRLGDIEIEPGDHGEVGKRCALHHDRIDRVEHQRRRHHSPRLHLVQHPGGGDPTLGRIEHQHTPDIALAKKPMLGTREDAAHSVEIVARGEAVLGDQRLTLHRAAHSRARMEDFGAHRAILPPLQAASMQPSMESSAGL